MLAASAAYIIGAPWYAVGYPAWDLQYQLFRGAMLGIPALVLTWFTHRRPEIGVWFSLVFAVSAVVFIVSQMIHYATLPDSRIIVPGLGGYRFVFWKEANSLLAITIVYLAGAVMVLTAAKKNDLR